MRKPETPECALSARAGKRQRGYRVLAFGLRSLTHFAVVSSSDCETVGAGGDELNVGIMEATAGSGACHARHYIVGHGTVSFGDKSIK